MLRVGMQPRRSASPVQIWWIQQFVFIPSFQRSNNFPSRW